MSRAFVKPKRKSFAMPSVALVGAGNLAHALGNALPKAGCRVAEIMVRDRAESMARARALAGSLGAKIKTIHSPCEADLLWICIRDDSIAKAAEVLASSRDLRGKVAFHSSGALPSSALDALRRKGAQVAAVHPIMTFVPGSTASFAGVWFGMEGDAPALRMARRIIRKAGGKVLTLAADAKPLYHAWGAFASPMLVAVLAAAEQVAQAAGIPADKAHNAILPLVQQTVQNYAVHGTKAAFSGPLRRGDVATVARHLEALRSVAGAQEVYVALARVALRSLPVRNRKQLRRLLGDPDGHQAD